MYTRGVQKISSLTQLTTDYTRVLSPFNTVPQHKYAHLFFRSPDSSVDLVLQSITCNVDNILIVNKFPPCHEFLQLWIQTEDTGKTLNVIRQMASLFSKVDSNKLWHDVQNEENVTDLCQIW